MQNDRDLAAGPRAAVRRGPTPLQDGDESGGAVDLDQGAVGDAQGGVLGGN